MRVGFTDRLTGTTVPAVYCKDLFAEEIEKEKQGESDSTFFTDNFETREEFLDLYQIESTYEWICPNMTVAATELQATVNDCKSSKNLSYMNTTGYAQDTKCANGKDFNMWIK